MKRKTQKFSAETVERAACRADGSLADALSRALQ